MNRLNHLFNTKKENILNVYFTAGFPELNSTVQIIELLSRHGADIIEIGIPFSDPVADGPTIQASNKRALDNGMSLNLLFDQLKDIRKITQIPLVLMGYLNPVVRMGVEKFCEKCKEVGIDGLILPDLPVKEYRDHYQETFKKFGLSNVFFITPQTSEERIRAMDEATDTFLYMVSSPGITGAKSYIAESQIDYFTRIQAMQLKNPALIGFGISDNNTFMQASKFSSGAIIGSAFINALAQDEKLENSIPLFLNSILKKS
ncbi:MAG: tryptophan synthase subunit alpha [Cyclobacteriaceae bacterium]|nr:tryptophan synthase subunit alpha [Cyclobacteriaceae bacterium]